MPKQERRSLELTREQMQALGYGVVDLLVEHYCTLPDRPVGQKWEREELEALLREPLPEQGRDPMEVLGRVRSDVLGRMMHLDHPRFFAYVPGPSNFVGAMADALASGFNVFTATWLEASGAAQIELVTVDWLRRACGLPTGAGGLFVSGGSMANITALAVARHIKLENNMAGAVIYCSDQTHSSIARGLAVLGFEKGQLYLVPSDGEFKIDITELGQRVVEDRAAGRLPFCVVANAGTTNTGAVDPLPVLSEFCQGEDLWLHVDGAYGAAASLCERGRKLLVGLGKVDSLSLDPHKWLFQPYEIACVLVRDERWLKDAFHILPEYLEDAQARGEEVNYGDRGIQLTRGFRALKLWMSLQVFGRQAFAEALEHGLELAEVAESTVRVLPGWEVMTPAQLGVVTFRYAPEGMTDAETDTANRALVQAMVGSGLAMISSTVLKGQMVLRLCTINPRTTEDDVRETVWWLAREAERGLGC